ncbi:hypothetical protein [uncultured Dietzia sp.]|uniref:hypothetical protein n=1 Tax=uncultured Dietzia sp. TaxID=395519 RepID=UPI0025E478CC|nr:hypothetical protein [uncultured Dietzia sp.]
MTFSGHPLPLVTMQEIRVGLAVALVGGDESIPELERTSPDGVTHELHDGHPGVVSDCSMPDHVLVMWEGLERAGISTAIGFAADEQGTYPGLRHRMPPQESHLVSPTRPADHPDRDGP